MRHYKSVLPMLGAALGVAVLVATPVSAFELRKGVVIDDSRHLAFVASPEGAVETIDMVTGTVIWHSTDAFLPLAVIDGFLVAQVFAEAAGGLPLAVLDAQTGRLVLSIEAPLPDHVRALVGAGLGTSFRVTVEPAGGRLLIQWSHSFQLIRGVPPEEGGAGPTVTTGAFLLDYSRGVVSEARDVPVASWPSIELYGGDRLSRVSGRQFMAANGQYVLASEPDRDAATAAKYTWTIVSTDGDPLGTVSTPISYAPFHVAGRVVVYVLRPHQDRVGDEYHAHPLSLHAVNIDSGAEQWVREIRDTTFYGPFPP